VGTGTEIFFNSNAVFGQSFLIVGWNRIGVTVFGENQDANTCFPFTGYLSCAVLTHGLATEIGMSSPPGTFESDILSDSLTAIS